MVIAKSQVTVTDVAVTCNEAQVETCVVDPEPQLVHEDGGILTSSLVLKRRYDS